LYNSRVEHLIVFFLLQKGKTNRQIICVIQIEGIIYVIDWCETKTETDPETQPPFDYSRSGQNFQLFLAFHDTRSTRSYQFQTSVITDRFAL